MIPKSIMLQVCSHCGEVASGAIHGHGDFRNWQWQWVEYVPANAVEDPKPEAVPEPDGEDLKALLGDEQEPLSADDDPPYR